MKPVYSFVRLSQLKVGDIFAFELKPQGPKYELIRIEKGMAIVMYDDKIEQFSADERVIKID